MKASLGTLVLAIASVGVLSAQPQQYLISTVAGGASASQSTPPQKANSFIGGVENLAVDAAGNVYFGFANEILKLDQSGVITQFAGSGAGYSGDGGPAVNARLSLPGGMAVDATGNLFVIDAQNLRIRRVAPSGIITTVAGNGIQGNSGDGGPAVDAEFKNPAVIATDAAGNVFVGDGNLVRKISVTGIITTLAGNGTAGFSGDGGPATSAQLSGVSGLAVDGSGDVYIADFNNLRVRKVTPDGIITTVAGNGQDGEPEDGSPAVDAPLIGPTALAVDPSGNLFIADSDWDDQISQIRKVSPDGVIITAAGQSFWGFTGDGGPATNAFLTAPTGLAADAIGNLFIADTYNDRVRKISPSGIITTVAGNGPAQPARSPASLDGVTAMGADLGRTLGVALDSSGDPLILDSYGVTKLTPDGVLHTATTQGGEALTVDAAGNLFVAGLAINEVAPGGAVTHFVGSGAFGTPGSGGNGIAVDPAGNLFVGSGYVVSKISPAGVATTIAGGGEAVPGDGGLAIDAFLNDVTGQALDGAGNLYFSETYGYRVRKMTPDGIITTIAGNGKAGYSGDGGPATSAQLGGSDGLAFDAAGNLYIADTYNNAIRLVTPDGTITTIAGTPGSRGYFGDGGLAVAAQLSYPYGVAVDRGGNIFVADTGNGAIRELRPSHAALLISSVVDAASERPGPVSPGKIVVIYGAGLGPTQLIQNPPANGQIGTSLGGTTVSFNGIAAPVLYASSMKVAVTVPYALNAAVAQVTVTYSGQTSAPYLLTVAPSAPGIFTTAQTGGGQMAAINMADGTVNSAANPAKVGASISFYATGGGQTSPAGVDGQLGSSADPKPILPVTVTIGGLPATVQSATGVAGQIAGLMQVTVQIPSGVRPGGYIPVVLQVGEASTLPDATWIAVSQN